MCDLRLVSCLEKVFYDEAPAPMKYAPEGLIGEDVSFQLAWKAEGDEFRRDAVYVRVESPVAEYVTLRAVRCVPVRYAAIPCEDDNYLRKEPGLYPDLLEAPEDGRLRLFSDHWESAYLTLRAPDSLEAGKYPICLKLVSESGEVLSQVETVYTRVNARINKQKLIHTRWFHCDGLCSYYGIEMFSEEFWRVCENFVRSAAEMSVNCLLTPIHTPPLDTRVGGERLTCQLVDIEKRGGEYAFGFEKLERWVRMAQRSGIEYFEMAHFFTQWGAEHAPKIMATEHGEFKRIFGWETEAAGGEYMAFLNQYIPALRREFERLGILDKCFFHISDEPNITHIEQYRTVRAGIARSLEGLTVIDALSNIDFYTQGIVTKPVPALDHISPFLDAGVPGLWTYYCVGQYRFVSNAFISMPSARTRIIGTQLYKFGIEGFLQWGFNFYNSQYSNRPINPYLTTDGDGFSPAGDCFLVYPGKGGKALESLRYEAFRQAVYDMRALDTLADRIGRGKVLELIDEGIEPLGFEDYPKSADYVFELRRKVNRLLDGGARA